MRLHSHNKAFKRDSCHVAFLVCVDFCGEGGLQKVGLCGTHPLTRHYSALKIQGLSGSRKLLASVFSSSIPQPYLR
ncbi:DUF3265 domain-containing protein [Vibrio sp. S9_S30]|nr:DUF3265 domain-containing protein [Vibrio sp. S9_S30]